MFFGQLGYSIIMEFVFKLAMVELLRLNNGLLTIGVLFFCEEADFHVASFLLEITTFTTLLQVYNTVVVRRDISCWFSYVCVWVGEKGGGVHLCSICFWRIGPDDLD